MDQSVDNLTKFASCVEDMPHNAGAEAFVRLVLEGVAKKCPMDVLVKLGKCVVDIRIAELRAKKQAEMN